MLTTFLWLHFRFFLSNPIFELLLETPSISSLLSLMCIRNWLNPNMINICTSLDHPFTTCTFVKLCTSCSYCRWHSFFLLFLRRPRAQLFHDAKRRQNGSCRLCYRTDTTTFTKRDFHAHYGAMPDNPHYPIHGRMLVSTTACTWRQHTLCCPPQKRWPCHVTCTYNV